MLFPKSLRNTWELMNFIGNMVGTLKSKINLPHLLPPKKRGNWALLVHVELLVSFGSMIFLFLKLTTFFGLG
jgi:hypothetical protein